MQTACVNERLNCLPSPLWKGNGRGAVNGRKNGKSESLTVWWKPAARSTDWWCSALASEKAKVFFYVAQSQTTISHMAVWIKLANQYNRGSIFILECRVNFLSPRDNTNGQAIPCKLFFGLNVWNCCLLVCSLVYVEIVMRPWPRMNRVLVRMFLQLWNSYQGTPVTKLTKCEAILSVWNSKSKFSFAFPFHEPELCSHVNISMG